MTRIVGLDLSLTSTGVAVIDGGRVIALHSITSKGTNADTLQQRRERLVKMFLSIQGAIYPGIDLAVIEGPDTSRATGKVHDRSGLWWRVLDDLMSGYVPVAEVTPSALKKYATGNGAAGKTAVTAAVTRRYPEVLCKTDDECDALVLAAMGARSLGQPIDDMPQTHLVAMAKVAWPEGVTA